MKANELQIGDFVMYNPNVFEDDEYIPQRPSSPVKINSGEDIDLACEGCYEPIPLTPEIFEGNGFENKADYEWSIRVKDYYVIYNRNYMPTLSIGKIDNMDMEDEEINYESTIYFEKVPYVHELQHALRLCGLNDLADNFKV